MLLEYFPVCLFYNFLAESKQLDIEIMIPYLKTQILNISTLLWTAHGCPIFSKKIINSGVINNLYPVKLMLCVCAGIYPHVYVGARNQPWVSFLNIIYLVFKT